MAHRFGGTCPSPCVGMRPWSVGHFCGTDVFRKCPGVSSGTVQNVGDKVGDENRNKNLSLNNNFLYFYFRYSWSHLQDHTARCLVEQCAAHYVMTAVKDNRPELLRDLAGLDWERPEVRTNEHRSSDKGHGRLEKRSCRVFDLTAHRDEVRVPHRQVAFRIERERHIRKTGKVEHETVHGPDLPAPRPCHRRGRPRSGARALGASKRTAAQTAPGIPPGRGSFRVTHPFHPLTGRRFMATGVLRWRDVDHVVYRDEENRERRIPASWTDVSAAAGARPVSPGHDALRVVDLVALAALLSGLEGR